MKSGGNNFNHFPKKKLTKLANLVQFKHMLMFCLEDWGGWAPGPTLSTPLVIRLHNLTNQVFVMLPISMQYS